MNSITILKIVLAEKGRVVVLFDKYGMGAPNWAVLVDSYKEVLSALQARYGATVKRPDGDTSLGRGGRRVMTLRFAAIVLRAYKRQSAIKEALATGTLEIIASPKAAKAIKAELRKMVAKGKAKPPKRKMPPIEEKPKKKRKLTKDEKAQLERRKMLGAMSLSDRMMFSMGERARTNTLHTATTADQNRRLAKKERWKRLKEIEKDMHEEGRIKRMRQYFSRSDQG